MTPPDVTVLLPALDEEPVVAEVVRGFLDQGARVVVVDNGSRDATGLRARKAGAEVVLEARRGYGSACLAGIEYLRSRSPPRYLVISDCDGSTDPSELACLLDPLREQSADIVLGRRVPEGSAVLPLHQSIGNWALVRLVRGLYGLEIHDLASFRAGAWPVLLRLGLREATYGLTLETVVRGYQMGAHIREVPIRLRPRRAGRSKVAGSVWGTARAVSRILFVCLTMRLRPWTLEGKHVATTLAAGVSETD